MVEVLLFFVLASLLLYVVLGGADYGAGILELLPAGDRRERQKKLINYAMGPVWEANHMWLIIVVVILFMGFPFAFQALMVSLHIPMVALLVGIVLRGAVFAFRHYDAIQEPKSQAVYTACFGLSSLWTSLWLGIIAASIFRGQIDIDARDFWAAYMAPWWGIFPLAMGVFVSSIFAFLASIYLAGETDDYELKHFFHLRAFAFNILVVVAGAAVFLASHLEGGSLLKDFLAHPFALGCVVQATLLFVALWFLSIRRHTLLTRIVAAGQTALILFGWYLVHAPHALYTKTGPIDFYQAAAPEATLRQLNIALLVGSLLIFPSLFFLLRVFKRAPAQASIE